MITKPISLSPDSEVVTIADDALASKILTLTAEVHTGSTLETFTENGKEYCYASLVLRANNRDYVFTRPYGVSDMEETYIKARIERQTYSIKVIIELDLNSTLVGVARVGRWGTDDDGNDKYTQKIYENPKLNDLILAGSQLSWKIRLFEKSSLSGETYVAKNVIGYGSIDSVTHRDSSDDTPIKETIIAIAPHTNIYDAIIGHDYIDGTLGIRPKDLTESQKVSRMYIIETFTNIMKHYDENMRYYININGRQIPIKYYRLFPAGSESETVFSDMDGADDGLNYYKRISKYFDGYGNPLAGYAVVDYTKEFESVIQEGDTYQICCNYIDSTNAYFEVYSAPSITIRENNGKILMTDENPCTENNPYELNYYNLNLTVDFVQAQGIGANYFYYKIYEYSSQTNSYRLKYSSGNQYNREILIGYDELFNDKKYKVVISIVDTTQQVHERELYFYTALSILKNNDGTAKTFNATAEYYPAHNSIIIDWSAAIDEINQLYKGVGIELTKILKGFKVYKTLGDSDILYEIGNISGNEYTVLEDFVVGDNCKYVYYIYPIIYNMDIEKAHNTRFPIITNEITLNQGIDKVFALNKIGERTYEVDTDWVWRLYLNLGDNGFTVNNDKTFYDTLATYSQESVGNRKYITKSVSALIGSINCGSGDDYLDTYDMLVSWNEFSTSPSLKCLIDIRGLILPGNFETNPSVEYLQGDGNPANAKFNWRQKSDLSIIKIYGTLLPFNPLHDIYLYSSDNKSLESSDDKLLYEDVE